MIDFASLAWFAVYGAAILGIGLALRQVARGSEGPTLADLIGGYADPPWPHRVQEEEPVRWNLAALSRRTPDVTRTEPGRPYSPIERLGTRQACPPPA